MWNPERKKEKKEGSRAGSKEEKADVYLCIFRYSSLISEDFICKKYVLSEIGFNVQYH